MTPPATLQGDESGSAVMRQSSRVLGSGTSGTKWVPQYTSYEYGPAIFSYFVASASAMSKSILCGRALNDLSYIVLAGKRKYYNYLCQRIQAVCRWLQHGTHANDSISQHI